MRCPIFLNFYPRLYARRSIRRSAQSSLTAESTHYNNDLAIDIGFAIRFRWVLLLLLLFLVAAAVWIFAEPGLSPEAKGWINQSNRSQPEATEAYEHLAGLSSYANESVPENIQQLATQLKSPGAGSTLDRDSSATDNSDSLYCQIREIGCLRNLLNNAQQLRLQRSTHTAFVDQFDEFLAFKQFRSPIGDEAAELSHPYLLFGAKVSQFDVITTAVSGKASQATQMLTERIEQFRSSLALMDTLALKMVFTALIIDDLDLVAGLYARNLIGSPDSLMELSPPEMSMLGPLRREFFQHVSNLEAYDKDPKSIELSDQTEGLASWISGLTYSKNRAINSIYTQYRKLLVKASLPTIIVDDSFLRGSGRVAEAEKSLLDVNNLVSSIFARGDREDLSEYIFRLRDIESKLKLLRIRFNAPARAPEPFLDSIPDSVDLSNPYNPQQTVAYDQSNKTLCFEGPRPDHYMTRCIYTN